MKIEVSSQEMYEKGFREGYAKAMEESEGYYAEAMAEKEPERPSGDNKLIDANAFWGRVIQSRKETIIDDNVTISMAELIKLLDDEPTIIIPVAELDTTTEEIRPHNEWTPCSERLPEEHHIYLATIKKANGITLTVQSYFFTKEVGWSDACVIAWMPIPEPYKKEGGENDREASENSK